MTAYDQVFIQKSLAERRHVYDVKFYDVGIAIREYTADISSMQTKRVTV